MATIEIRTAEEFVALADLEDKGSSTNLLDIVITADLDFSNIENFSGLNCTLYANIDGGGHSIKNIVGYSTASKTYWLGYIYNGTVQNIVIDNCHLTSTTRTANLIYCSNANLKNIIIKNNNSFTGNIIKMLEFYKSTPITIDNVAIGGTYYCNIFYGMDFSGNKTYATIRNYYAVCDVTTTGSTNYGLGYFYYCYIYNCWARINAISKSTTATLYGFGFIYYSTAHFCYGASQVAGGTFKTIYGVSNNNSTTAIQCLYDKTLLPSASGAGTGVPTETLQSPAELRALGWAI